MNKKRRFQLTLTALAVAAAFPSYAAKPETAASDATQSQSLKEITVRARQSGTAIERGDRIGQNRQNVGNVEQRTGTQYPRPDALRSGRSGCRTGQRLERRLLDTRRG